MGERNQTLDALRAVAALWVCLFHFTAATGIGAHGYLGVTMFFVISGYIVPYSMVRRGYTAAAWPRFMLRRLVRLEPPYLVSVALILALGAVDTLRGTPPEWTAAQIAGHLGYANAFLGLPWLNAPYWSLAIELQFYVLMGLALPPLMRARTPAARLAGVALAACVPLFLPDRSNATMLPSLPIFAAGTLTFLRATENIGHKSYWAALAASTMVVFATNDARVALATAGTAVVIATVRLPRVAPVAWLGTISYSLYLLHVPVGYRVLGVFRRWSDSPLLGIAAMAGALAAAVAAAALLHRYVERPALRLATRIGYRPAPSASRLPAGPALPERAAD
jgi:peptidoglycan/LPS O-acetylase OafA/YrhL